jgi:hypothetical protein
LLFPRRERHSQPIENGLVKQTRAHVAAFTGAISVLHEYILPGSTAVHSHHSPADRRDPKFAVVAAGLDRDTVMNE